MLNFGLMCLSPLIFMSHFILMVTVAQLYLLVVERRLHIVFHAVSRREVPHEISIVNGGLVNLYADSKVCGVLGCVCSCLGFVNWNRFNFFFQNA